MRPRIVLAPALSCITVFLCLLVPRSTANAFSNASVLESRDNLLSQEPTILAMPVPSEQQPNPTDQALLSRSPSKKQAQAAAAAARGRSSSPPKKPRSPLRQLLSHQVGRGLGRLTGGVSKGRSGWKSRREAGSQKSFRFPPSPPTELERELETTRSPGSPPWTLEPDEGWVGERRPDPPSRTPKNPRSASIPYWETEQEVNPIDLRLALSEIVTDSAGRAMKRVASGTPSPDGDPRGKKPRVLLA